MSVFFFVPLREKLFLSVRALMAEHTGYNKNTGGQF
jgi:hypothetical protein